MSVNLSPVAGAAAQFLDNSGNVLTGGKLYTYAAGTTTPQATYTSSSGLTAHTNPIILDAAGRVPAGGEIWLDQNILYKFVLKDSNDVLIGTYDNISTFSDPTANDIIYTPPFTGGVPTTVSNKLSQYVSIKDFGAFADGINIDNTAVLAAESSIFDYIDLVGCNVITTLDESQINKFYFNGTLTYKEANNTQAYVKPISPLTDIQIQRRRTKSPRIDWKDKRVLWLGTSIPIEGGFVDSYPILFGKALNCTVDNLAWAGSSGCYDVDGDPFEIATVKRLSMTDDDRLAGLALYGPSSAYDDSFDAITKASKMTCDYRIKDQFDLNPYDCVMLDHNHNDRTREFGILYPTTTDVTSVTIGLTTTFTASGHGLDVGDAVILRINGINYLDYAAGRVQSVSGSTFVLNIDSSAYTGIFTSGTVAKVNRDTLCGAWNFLISYTKNCIIRFGNSDCDISLSGAPNEYTAGRTKPYEVYSNAENIRKIADKWNLSFFDIGFYYDIKPHDEPIYFPDGFHPTTPASRQSLTNQWTTWAQGGAVKKSDETDFLPTGALKTFTNQREALYTKYLNGFGTPSFIAGTPVNLLTDTFASLAGWTTVGTPTAGAAPWGAGNAVQFNTTAATLENITQNVTFTNGTTIQVDVYVPTVTGLTTGAPKTVGIINQRITVTGSPGGSIGGAQLIVRETGISLRGFIFTASGVVSYVTAGAIDAATKYTVKLEIVQGTTAYNGAFLMYVNGDYVGGQFDLDFTSFLTLPKSLALGINSNNLGAFNMYMGNLVVDSVPIYDYTQRYTGTFTSADSKTVTVVNGIIVSAV